MEERTVKLINWIRSGMNYLDGISLILEFSARKGFQHQFIGKENRMKDKLTYELCKAAKVANFSNWRNYISSYSDGNHIQQVDRSTKKEKAENHRCEVLKREELISGLSRDEEEFNPAIIYGKRNDEYPVLIKRISFDLGNLYQQRSLLHTQMATMEQSNRKVIVKERVKLLDQIKMISDRFIFLYLTKQRYLKDRSLPEEREVYQENNELSAGKTSEISNPDDLKRQKKNLQTSNSKDQKKLEGLKSNLNQDPGIKDANRFTVLETRIRERISQIEELDYKLVNT